MLLVLENRMPIRAPESPTFALSRAVIVLESTCSPQYPGLIHRTPPPPGPSSFHPGGSHASSAGWNFPLGSGHVLLLPGPANNVDARPLKVQIRWIPYATSWSSGKVTMQYTCSTTVFFGIRPPEWQGENAVGL